MRTSSLASWPLLLLVSCAGSKPVAPPAALPTPPADAPGPAIPPGAPSASGIWLGELHAGKKKLRVQIRLDIASTPPGCLADSIDERAFNLPCSDVLATPNSFSFRIPDFHGHFEGALSPDANRISGTWFEQGPQPLVLLRQAQALDASAAPKDVPLDPAIPPVSPASLREVLDKDLASSLATGDLAPSTGAGVVIGVLSHGARKVLSYGNVKPDAVFEIGSVTKTFTGLLLAQMVVQEKVRLDEPVRALLPSGTVAAPASGSEITLLDLSAQRSGLPRMPDNFKPSDPRNPYADYDAQALYAFVGNHGLALPARLEFGYSNLGVGLLGQALSDRAGMTYEALLSKQISGPLELRETVITLPPALLARMAQGHDAEHHPAHLWDLTSLAGAGAIRSTASDMLRYLQAQLHPDRLPTTALGTREGKTLPEAIVASHTPQQDVGQGRHVALNWFRDDASGSLWHDGGTGGYSSYAWFNAEKDVAVVVLANTYYEDEFTDRLGEHVAQRLTGKAAVSLAPAP